MWGRGRGGGRGGGVGDASIRRPTGWVRRPVACARPWHDLSRQRGGGGGSGGTRRRRPQRRRCATGAAPRRQRVLWGGGQGGAAAPKHASRWGYSHAHPTAHYHIKIIRAPCLSPSQLRGVGICRAWVDPPAAPVGIPVTPSHESCLEGWGASVQLMVWPPRKPKEFAGSLAKSELGSLGIHFATYNCASDRRCSAMNASASVGVAFIRRTTVETGRSFPMLPVPAGERRGR